MKEYTTLRVGKNSRETKIEKEREE